MALDVGRNARVAKTTSPRATNRVRSEPRRTAKNQREEDGNREKGTSTGRRTDHKSRIIKQFRGNRNKTWASKFRSRLYVFRGR